jgi:hypothetical protein
MRDFVKKGMCTNMRNILSCTCILCIQMIWFYQYHSFLICLCKYLTLAYIDLLAGIKELLLSRNVLDKQCECPYFYVLRIRFILIIQLF